MKKSATVIPFFTTFSMASDVRIDELPCFPEATYSAVVFLPYPQDLHSKPFTAEYHAEFYARMAAEMSAYQRRFGSLIVNMVPGLGEILVQGNYNAVHAFLKESHGRILQYQTEIGMEHETASPDTPTNSQ